MSKVIYVPKVERWYGVYYPGLPCNSLTDEELEQLAQVHEYDIEFIRGLYASCGEEEIEDAGNAFA